MWSHDVVASSINLAGDLKLGQYLKIPPRAMFITRMFCNFLFRPSLMYLSRGLGRHLRWVTSMDRAQFKLITFLKSNMKGAIINYSEGFRV